MAKARGTTRKPGKTRTAPPATVAGDRIDPPHGGSVKKVGAQTIPEAQDLRGPQGPGLAPKQVGPSEIRPINTPGSGSVKKVGGPGLWEDQVAAAGGFNTTPDHRVPGSVKSVGPGDVGYKLLVGRPMDPVQTQQARFAPKRGNRKDKGVPILKGGTGRARAWSKYAGQPGTQKGGITGVGASATGDTIGIAGRPRPTRREPFPARRDLVTPESAVVPGGTDLYPSTKKKFEEE